jgi:hypothetical protein
MAQPGRRTPKTPKPPGGWRFRKSARHASREPAFPADRPGPCPSQPWPLPATQDGAQAATRRGDRSVQPCPLAADLGPWPLSLRRDRAQPRSRRPLCRHGQALAPSQSRFPLMRRCRRARGQFGCVAPFAIGWTRCPRMAGCRKLTRNRDCAQG